MNARARLAAIGVGDDVVAVDGDAAGGRPQNAGDRAQGGGLAGAVGSDQPDDFASRQREGQVVDGREGGPEAPA